MLTDIGNEELNHVEMIGAILYQLTKNLTPDEIKAGGMDKYFVDHTLGVYPASAAGVPFPLMQNISPRRATCLQTCTRTLPPSKRQE